MDTNISKLLDDTNRGIADFKEVINQQNEKIAHIPGTPDAVAQLCEVVKAHGETMAEIVTVLGKIVGALASIIETHKENTAVVKSNFENTNKSFDVANENFKSIDDRLSLLEQFMEVEE
jgi:hypothetical protein